jgi:hypothetical protein
VELQTVVTDIADELARMDQGRPTFKSFRPGIGPFGEPQLVRELSTRLNRRAGYQGRVATRRCPDLVIEGQWGIEFKIVRPFGDNDKPAENWSVNLLHPYPGNVSAIGDCLKLMALSVPEGKAIAVIGYEHTPPQVELEPLIRSFELIAGQVMNIHLGQRVAVTRTGLVHPVHRQLTVFAWQLLGQVR